MKLVLKKSMVEQLINLIGECSEPIDHIELTEEEFKQLKQETSAFMVDAGTEQQNEPPKFMGHAIVMKDYVAKKPSKVELMVDVNARYYWRNPPENISEELSRCFINNKVHACGQSLNDVVRDMILTKMGTTQDM